MAELSELLALVPAEYTNLRAALKLVHELFPDAWDRIGESLIQRSLAKDDDQARDDIFQYVVGSQTIQNVLGVDADTAEQLILGGNEGGMNFSDFLSSTEGRAAVEGQGVLTGGQTIRVGERYYQVYEFPPGSGSFVSYQFNSEAQARVALGAGFSITARSESWYNQNVLSEGQAEEVVGVGGSWRGFMDEVMNDAAAAAGARDPSLIGRIASNPEMQRIMAQAVVGDWTPEQILAEQRQTRFWRETLYPGIQSFYGRTANPEQAWTNYNQNVTPALIDLGYARDADGTFNTRIRTMLNNGIDDQIFLENAPIFAQAVQNRDFFNVLRQRARRELGKDITFGNWFNLLKGEAAPDIAAVAEGAVVAYQAQQAGVGLGESMLQRLIAERDLSEAEARGVFSEVNQAALALGPSGLSRGGLSRDDIISAMANITPASGLNPEEVRMRVAKIVRENDLFDDEKISFYVGFTPAGTPVRPGLQPLAPEGA